MTVNVMDRIISISIILLNQNFNANDVDIIRVGTKHVIKSCWVGPGGLIATRFPAKIFRAGYKKLEIISKNYNLILGYIISTSAHSERDSSQAGLIRIARRAQMSAKKLSNVEF